MRALAVAIMCLVWGSTWFVLREGLEEMRPFGSASIRFFVAALVLWPIAPRLAKLERGGEPPWRMVLAMATGNVSISFGIVYWAEEVVPSGLAAVLWAVFPLITAVVGQWMLPGDRVKGLQWIGLLLGFVGVGLLFLTDIEAVGGEATFRSIVLLASPLVSAIATAYIKKHGAQTSSALLNRKGFLVGASFLLVAAFVFEGGVTVPTTRTAIFSIAYLSLIGTVLAFTLYFWVLRTASPVALSLITYVTPPIALFIGAWLGEEQVTGWTIAGLGLVLSGCAFVLRRPRTVV